ncbi:MAG: DUF87 domain-containing protein [Nitrososphaerota archaeon]|nr:DUF87 domain-containing protein [Nitrososphaerota archaeon]
MDRLEKEWMQETMELACKVPYVNKDLIERLLLVYALENDEKEKIRDEINSMLDSFSYKLFFSKKPILECPNGEEAKGEIKLGMVMQGERVLGSFGLSREELNQHVLITGRSGCGKTTLIIQIIRSLLSNSIPFLVLDYKMDYRHLIRLYPQLVVLNWKDLQINPLEPPPGVSFQEWKQQFLNIFGHVQGIWHGSTQYLLEAIDEVYEEKKRIPKIEEVYKKIVEANETSRKMQEYASVVETRLYGMLSKLGDTINNETTAIDIEKLLQMPVVLELHGLGRDEATFLTLWFFYWIYAYRRAKAVRGRLLHVLIIDEAKRIFTASEQYSQTTTEYSGVPPQDLICDEIREYSEAIIASDQEPTKLSNSLKANTYTKITGFLGNGRDIDDIAEAMDLSEEEREVITKLERGEWIVKLAGRYTKPFMIKTEDFPLKKNLSDEELTRRMQPVLEKLKFREKPTETKKDKVISLSEDAWKLLVNINAHPFNGIAGRAKELGFSPSRVEKAKNELLSKSFIVQVEISLSRRRPTSFLVLTASALSFLEARGIETKAWQYIGHVGFEHMLYAVLIKSSMQKLGYMAALEVSLGQRRIDVLAERNARKLAFEVELDASKDLHAKLDIAESVDVLYIVTSKQLFTAVKEKLGGLPRNVRLYSIDVLLEKMRYSIEKYSRIISSWPNKQESTGFLENQFVSSHFAGKELGGKGTGQR